MKNSCRMVVIMSLALAFFMAGCVSVKQPPPDKRYYALTLAHPNPLTPDPTGPTVRVRPFRVSPLYQDRSLVYRNSDLNFASDFYNEFLINPAPMFSAVTVQWLSATGIFNMVMDSAGRILPDYVLEGAVNSLYGDYRNPAQPSAVLEIQLYLIQAKKPDTPIILHKHDTRRIPLPDFTAESLVKGYNEAFRQILLEFEQDLLRIVL
jgi:cholesterol transport system auxiliary component